MRARTAKKWKNDGAAPACQVSHWLDAATPDPAILAGQVVRDCAVGRINVIQTRDKLNEIFAHIEANNLPPFKDAAEALSKPIPLPDDVIEGVVHQGGKIVFGGASKSFKTWLQTDLAVTVATGGQWLGKFPTKKGRVLFVNFELSEPFFWWRVRAICDENQVNLEPEMLTVLNLRGHVTSWPRLQQQIPPDKFILIILDPAYKLLLGKDENKTGDIANLFEQFDVLAMRTGATIATDHHYSKGNQAKKEDIDRPSGSGVFARDPDSLVNLTRHEKENCFTVTMTLRVHPQQKPFVVKWQFPVFAIDSLLDPAKLKQVGRPRTYDPIELLEVIDDGMRAGEIAKTAREEMGWPERRTFEGLKQLKADNLLKQPKRRGGYECV